MGTSFSGPTRDRWSTTVGGWTYTTINTSDFTVKWAVGSDDDTWQAWIDLPDVTAGVPFPTQSDADLINATD